MNLRELVSRRGLYRLQMALFALRRYVPGPLRQLLKPLYRRYWQRSARRRLAAALPQAAAERPAAGYAIVCLAGIDWELRFQRPQQLLSRLAAAGHPVYYLRLDFCAGQHAEPLEPLAVNVFGLRLPGPARLNIYQGLPSPEQVATWLAELETLAQEQALAEVVCLAHAPFWTPLALAAREKLGWRLVYDCLDEHAGFASNAAPVVAAEARLLAGADLVLATAQSLYEKCLPVARRCVRLPNAADVAHFARPPAEHPLEDLPRPIIGYYGALSEWFDAALLDVAAAAHPEWTFVLIGLNANADLRALERRPNVLLLGERPYVDLPAYLHAFDVAVIPFHVNALTRATNPVKFYEYLAAGKPVVAVELPELAPFRGLFYPATTPADFTLQLEAAVAERDPQRTAARVAAAQANTWDERTAQLKSEIQQLYGRAVIVIVSYQNLDYLRLCLDSVWAKTEYPHYSVVVVDNASGPDVTAYLREAQTREPRLQVVFNQTNIGFAGANNLPT